MAEEFLRCDQHVMYKRVKYVQIDGGETSGKSLHYKRAEMVFNAERSST